MYLKRWEDGVNRATLLPMLLVLLLGCRTPPTTPPTPPPTSPETVNLRIRATPADATIDFGPLPSASGNLELSDIAPGTYPLRVHRTGFRDHARLAPLDASSKDIEVSLTPIPQPFHLDVTPDDTGWSLVRNGELLVEGIGDWSGDIETGNITITASRDGYNEKKWSTYLDLPETARLWMDREGQIVEKLLEFKSGHHPKGLRFSPDSQEIWASFLGGPPSVAGYSATSGDERHELTLGKNGAVEVIYSLDGEKVYASQMETASVYEIDRDSGDVLRTLGTQATWSKVMVLSHDGSRMYVSNWVSSDITEFDVETGAVLRELDTVDTPRGLWLDGSGEWLYVLGFGNGKMERIWLESGKRETIFEGGGTLRHIVGDAERGRLYISDMRKGTIWLHEPETGRTRSLARTDANPNTIDLTPDGRLLFVSCRGQNNRESYYKPGPQWGSVLVFDALTGEKLDAIVAGNQPTALDVSDDGTLLGYSDMLDDRISVYRIPPREAFEGGGRTAVYKRELWKGRR